MLEKPDIPDTLILSHLAEEYGLQAAQLTFLPIGADINTAVYRAVTADGTGYFLKLRKGAFDEITVTVPQFLNSQGVREIIAPLESRSRLLWARFDPYKMILYPFVEGEDGYQVALTDRQWIEFGAALSSIHTANVPADLKRMIPREDFSPRWRALIQVSQDEIDITAYEDPVAVKFAAYMKLKRDVISHLVERAGQLARTLQSRSLDFVLCHSDIHPGNLLLGENGLLYIVDWDNPFIAPKERDLMLIGGCSTWHDPREEALFYSGYDRNYSDGPVEVDRTALTYYRYERIIWDIAAYCEQLLMTSAGGEDREQSYQYFLSIFKPGGEIEIALKTDPT
jgi:spectinomycin phosphotransferase